MEYMYPFEIRFTHDSIQSNFSDGYSIPETFRQILWKKITAEDLPLIEVMKYEGSWFVVQGNRRLFLFQELQRRCILSKVKVQPRKFDLLTFKEQYKSSNEGKNTLIRDFRHHAMKQELDEIWFEYEKDKEAEINRKTVVVTAILTLVGLLVLLKTQTQY